MRTFTIAILFVSVGTLVMSASPDYVKARVFSVNVGSVLPAPEDSGNESKEEHERNEHKTGQEEQAAFVILRGEKGMVVVKVPCSDHCLSLKSKLVAARDVEYREEGTKVWIKLPDQILEGTRFRPDKKQPKA